MDPLVSYTFCLEIDGIQAAFFREVQRLRLRLRSSSTARTATAARKSSASCPAEAKWSDITLKRGSTDDLSLWDWHKKILDGDILSARKNGSVVIYDTMLKEVARFNFINGWPSKWKGPDLNAGDSNVAIEEITIAHEGLVRKK